ncbi:uncharacterized protein LOC106464034 [Limulus polyphemus]|uniref:Uncharacterized protein LOC106464034 n=1 Tax=Limulus polyphemus TaxID=6850 RepID=A0ABM1SUS9_LIMPO|nr:uncharacterized protein LOC106464034 [Limulus polyphemus]
MKLVILVPLFMLLFVVLMNFAQCSPQFTELFCANGLSSKIIQKRHACFMRELPTSMRNAWNKCKSKVFKKNSRGYIRKMCSNTKAKNSMFQCVTQKMANGQVNLSSLRGDLNLQNCLEINGQ